MSYAQGSRCYEQLWVLDVYMTLGRELKALDAMNSSRFWMICRTLGRELKALVAMNNSRLWMI